MFWKFVLVLILWFVGVGYVELCIGVMLIVYLVDMGGVLCLCYW